MIKMTITSALLKFKLNSMSIKILTRNDYSKFILSVNVLYYNKNKIKVRILKCSNL